MSRAALPDLRAECAIALLRQQAHYYRQAGDELHRLADDAERQARQMVHDQADVEAAMREADRQLGQPVRLRRVR